MVCKQCGTYCGEGKPFCPVCRAPLAINDNKSYAQGGAADYPSKNNYPSDNYPAGDRVNADYRETYPQGGPPKGAYGHSEAPPQSGWGFVPSPKWPKPNFDINSFELENGYNERRPSNYDSGVSGSYQSDPYHGAPYQGDPNQGGPYQGDPYQGDPYRGGAYQNNNNGYQGEVNTDYTYQNGGYGNFGDNESYYPEDNQYNPYDQPVLDYQGADGEYVNTQQRPAESLYAYENDSSFSFSMGKNKKSRSSLKRGRVSRRGKKRLIFMSAAAALVILLLVFGIILIKNRYLGFSGFFNSVFKGSPVLKEATVDEGVNENGVECYIIHVYALKGTEVSINYGAETKSAIITDADFKIELPKYMLKSTKPEEGPTTSVAPNVTLKAKDGEVIQLEIPEITIDVPALDFSLTSPESNDMTVTRNKVTFTGQAHDNTTEVTIDGQPVTIENDGSFTYEYELSEPGRYTINIEQRKPGYQISRSTYSVNYDKAQQANIELDRSTLRVAGTGDTVNVKGKIDPGASLSLTAPSGVTLGEPEVNTATGDFSFSAKMDEVGHYLVNASITSDGSTQTTTINIERAPDLKEYSSKTSKIDYERMTKETLHKDSYLCVGNVVEIIQDEPYPIARLTTSAGDIIFEYHNTAASVELNDGKTYNVFGDYLGLDEATGLPLVYAWFITKSS